MDFPLFPGLLGWKNVKAPFGKNTFSQARLGNQPTPYRGLSGPPGPKCQKSLENVSRDPGPETPKVSEKSRGQSGKSPESLGKVSGECFSSVPGLFGDFWGPRAGGPGDIFETFLAFRAQRA